jgi:hypothetical protein
MILFTISMGTPDRLAYVAEWRRQVMGPEMNANYLSSLQKHHPGRLIGNRKNTVGARRT